MRKLPSAVLAGLLAFPLFTINQAAAAESPDKPIPADVINIAGEHAVKKKVIPDELIIQVKKGEKPEQIADRHGLEVDEKADKNVALVTFDAKEDSAKELSAELGADQAVVQVQPNYKYTISGFTNDPYSAKEWGLDNTGQKVNNQIGQKDVDMNIPEAWNQVKGKDMKEVVVAVLDTGIDIGHPDLERHIWTNEKEMNGRPGIDDDGNGYVDDVHGWDFLNHDQTVFDSPDNDLHGTHVAGTIAAGINDGIGVAGIAPNVKIMPLKFIGPDGGTTFDAIEAIHYAQKMGADVINSSWAGEGGFNGDALEQAIAQSGILFVAAAGNESKNIDVRPSYPASYKTANILSVAAVDNRGNLASFSNYGKTSVDVAAPGVAILSTVPRQYSSLYADYGYADGTSMAAPHVSGAAALLLGLHSSSTVQLIDALKATGKPLVSGSGDIGTGDMIDASAAISKYTAKEAAPAPQAESKPVPKTAPAKEPTFTDVPSGHWAFADVEWAVDRGLIKGYANHTFKPDHKLTEAQLAVIMSRYFNSNIEKTADQGAWYGKYYAYLKANGIVLPGHSNSKVIEMPVNRITIARSLAKSQNVTGTDKQIIDWMYTNGLTTGRGKSSDKYVDFGSKDNLTRAQISAFFKRMDAIGMTKIK